MITIRVTDEPFCAKGDGVTNDREAIQNSIDTVSRAGGGTVILTGGLCFYTASIVLRSDVTLLFEDGAVLQQKAGNDGYVKPCGDDYVPYKPHFGHNFSDEIKWSHYWYWNYPFIFAPEGSHNFAVRGRGKIRMMEVTDESKIVKLCPVGFYRCSDFEISDVHICNYHGYAMMPFTSENGLIKNVKITDACYGNGDGICLMNCRNMRITGCEMMTGDDSLYIFSSYRDPRKSEWWSSDDPQTSENIEIDHNDLRSRHCKAFGMILWGIECPDLEKVEVRNVYVHDNHFETMGNWLWNPYSSKKGNPPVTSLRFENNVIDGIECNFFETAVSDMNYFHSMTQIENGNFENGRVFWVMKKNSSDNSVFVVRDGNKNGNDKSTYGCITDFDKGDCELYQGVYLEKGRDISFFCETMTAGNICRMFVRNSETGEYVASLDFSDTVWSENDLHFTVPESGNYQLGIQRGESVDGFAGITHAVLGFNGNAFGYKDVYMDHGKVIFRYNDNLFKR